MNGLDTTKRQVLRHGQIVTVSHGQNTVSCCAFVRGFTPDELAGGIELGDKLVVIAGDVAFTWGEPVKNDKMLIAGKTASIMSVETVFDGDMLVRRNLVVRGA